ncbi:AMP-binding protein [Streptomyces sp. BE133]|uniref:AMP-binding protein n=1 Tax=Streptomyces sp. BE133 TaxID=3002523 RepID=UPI002E7755E2|nr:AMP-binding protein [Streptomyces sp. BE133]MEE1806561.1 AMP-binding protein [Streptomyces sp. BE133]
MRAVGQARSTRDGLPGFVLGSPARRQRGTAALGTAFPAGRLMGDCFGVLRLPAVDGHPVAGAAAVVVDVRRHGPAHLAQALADRGATVFHSTPTVYRYLVDALGGRRLDTVRAVVLGGETVTRHDALRCRAHFAPDCVFVNGYGVTEASFAVQDHLPPDAVLEHDVLPIGYPLAGYAVSLLGPGGDQSADEGEIVIHRPYVAPGYWQAPDPTVAALARHLDGDAAPTAEPGLRRVTERAARRARREGKGRR